MTNIQWPELIIFAILFAVVTVLGFVASRWKAGNTLDHLDEWGLGGRKFGSWITWFLLGGDLYTAYTFVAVPALMFSAGAMGMFALPYTIIVYPIVLMPALRMWSVSRVRGYVTPADFVRGRFGSPTLALLIAITGIIATMPYIALQLVGLEAVLRTMGINGSGIVGHLPLLVAFIILAVYTYQSGLRAPALIAFVKDILIYLVIIVAIIYLPSKLGGWSAIFDAADAKFDKTQNPADGILLTANNQLQYATLALGSALALFLYPHSLTSVLASRGRSVIKRNMVALPAYSLVLGLLALLGYVAISASVSPITNNATGKPDTNTVVPVLFDSQFSSWFAGIAFAAIGIGALVPAAIMSIAAANLWTRNIYKEYIKKNATPGQEAKQAKLASLIVKFGAVAFILFIDPQFSIDLQLIGGVLILQTLPAVAISLYTRWFHRWGLIAGWVVGIGWGLIMLYGIPNAATGKAHFGGSALSMGNLSIFGWHPFGGSQLQIYVGFVALVANLLVAVIFTVIARQLKVFNGTDSTEPEDYHADEHDKDLREIGVH
ncbi:monocarboxylate uptake permease MctP [Amycolatopsis regifaucium]|uniref:Sodium:solute symporter n=1 Tax=Amycolatopsis regifaucium TaxID=546365 RepID=A0A154ML06_9PSEU|nr:sodium:solute symporter family protein [Amycolatopsis regifaucium]KZB85002.1 sodium:solute symporter [Amycolatopsis regifaucium]OKA04022.1 sodium:solute symporter [Amycolatopsis regifaucium]SFH97641.1 solute:Na+ symporter, SSS family [Amycolatopsis regifaucium]